MTGPVRWRGGPRPVHALVEAWLAGRVGAEVLRDDARRRLVRLRGAAAAGDAGAAAAGGDPSGLDVVVKQFRVGSGRHRLRERLKAPLGRSPGDREARRLAALHARGVPVPEPLARGVLPDGDRLLVMRFVPGESLDEVLAGPARRRAARLEALGRALRALHEGGVVHGDLHAGNLRFGPEGPVLLDLQHARRRRAAARRVADLGKLDYSLWDRAGLADRVRLRATALGLARPFGPEARAALRAVGRAAEHRARGHGRRRTRRALRAGHRFAPLARGRDRGLRVPDLPAASADAALAAHDEALRRGDARVIKADPRSALTSVHAGDRMVVVKEVPPRGIARLLADAVRGSAARRAWRAGHGLRARAIGAARPLAWLERRRAGLPVRSWLLLEQLDPAGCALDLAKREPAATLEALLALVARMHRRHVDHGDLKCTHVFVDPRDGRARLIDLDGVRFPRTLSAERRLAALAELNASLPDEVPADLRRAALARYLARTPLPGGLRAVQREVVRRSLARRHRWTGAGCRCARAEAGAPDAPAGARRARAPRAHRS